MKPNIGNGDRVIRLIAGLGIVGVGVYFKSWWGLLGLLPLMTGLVSFCPLYKLLGMSTRSKKSVQ